MACYAYEDLQTVFARMDKALPGRDRPLFSNVSPADGWGWRSAVIEAKPLSIALLDTENWDGWRFRGDSIPDKYQNTQGRRWYIAEQTRCPPRDGQAAAIQGLGGMGLPSGVTLWHAPDDARRLLCLARHDSHLLLDALPGLALPQHESKGVLTLFEMPGPAELCFGDSVRLLRPHAPYLARLAEEYARGLCWMYGLSGLEFEESCRMHLSFHGPEGKTLELPPASPCRFENGPIVHVGVGRPVVEHDLAPSIRDPSGGLEWPVRVGVPEGAMVCLDGASRIRYAHGHPTLTTRAPWLTFTFMLDCNRRSTAMAYERETRSVVMQTPVLSERVVRTSKPAGEDRPVDRGDAVTFLVRSMRRRLRVAESHMIAAKYADQQRVTGGFMGIAENSSSSKVLA
jgi:hypothetical protein